MAGSLTEMTLPVAAAARLAHLLVVDDDASVRHHLGFNLGKIGYEVSSASTGEEALEAIAHRSADLVLLDLELAGMSGIETLRRLRLARPETRVIVLTGQASVERAVEAMRGGAHDFLVKPLDAERVEFAVRNALEIGSLTREVAHLRRELSGRHSFGEIVGADGGLRVTIRLLEKVLPTDLTVLLTGESGTGKELLARAIHHEGPRKQGPFVAINCAALPEHLLESELFGDEHGAMASPFKGKQGRFEQADGGTLFLDEIGEISPAVQAKLLRVLQERAVTRVGGSESRSVDVRILCATHRDLVQAVQSGSFREDLYYRITVFPIAIPPLRERVEDIAPLARKILRQASPEKAVGIHPSAMALLESYRWPGNVRELQNVLRRAVVLSSGETLRPEHLPANLFANAANSSPGSANSFEVGGRLMTLDELERAHILRALEVCKGNLSLVARSLEIGRTTLYRKLERYGVNP